MSEQNNTVETKVETVDIDIDEVFGAGADNVTLPEEESKPNIFSNPEKEVDMSFTEEPTNVTEETTEVPEGTETVNEVVEETGIKEPVVTETVKDEVKSTEASEVFDAIDEVDTDTEKSETPFTGGPKLLSGKFLKSLSSCLNLLYALASLGFFNIPDPLKVSDIEKLP